MRRSRVFGWVLAVLLVPAAFAWFASRRFPLRPQVASPPPELLGRGHRTLEQYREEMKETLQGVGWVDREKGLAHVPIDVAMQVLLARGLPTRKTESESGVKR